MFERPLLVIPPWINRYYIADLAPGKSLVEWAVDHGHTTFAVSFRNPDESMRDFSFDDYLRLGPLTAIDVVREIAGSETVNTLSICLGGTMTAMALAYLDACGDQFVHSATFLNCAVDYEGAGSLATVFADPATLESLMRRMERHGFLPGKDIAHTFDLLRANDLVFRYVIDGWLWASLRPRSTCWRGTPTAPTCPGLAHGEFLRRDVHRQRARARRIRGAGGAADDLGDRHDVVHRRRGRRPHRSVAGVVPHDPAVQGPGALRDDVGRSHRRDREPAGAEGEALDQRRAARATPTSGGRARWSTGTRGGRTGRRGSASERAMPVPRGRSAAPDIRRSATRRASTCGARGRYVAVLVCT